MGQEEKARVSPPGRRLLGKTRVTSWSLSIALKLLCPSFPRNNASCNALHSQNILHCKEGVVPRIPPFPS